MLPQFECPQTHIDKQYAAAVPNYSQLVTENRYAIYVLLTFT